MNITWRITPAIIKKNVVLFGYNPVARIYSALGGKHGSQKAEVPGHLECLTASAGPLQLSSSDNTIWESWVLRGTVLVWV